jgi:dipeptidyl aminopeptidase/acylaminoacyl peptidase
MKFRILLVALVVQAAVWAQEKTGYQRPPEVIAQIVEAPLTPQVVVSPDKNWLVLLERSDYPTIEELARPELRLAGLRINPENFGPSRSSYFTGIKLKSLKDQKEYPVTGLPAQLQLSNLVFSPDSKKIAVLQTYPDRIEAWWVDLSDFSAKLLTPKKVNAVSGTTLAWFSDSNALLLLTTANEGRTAPVRNRTPEGPVIEENLGKKAPARTYQDLLKNSYDESLFDFYATSQLVSVSLAGEVKELGKPAVYSFVNPSPDGKNILVRIVQKPYSYLVPVNSFPQQVSVWNRDGSLIKKLADVPLADNVPLGFDAVIKGPRNHSWRADAPATLVWAEALDEGDPKRKAELRDRVYTWSVPFAGTPQLLTDLKNRYAGIMWGSDKYAWLNEVWRADRRERIHQFAPGVPFASKVIFDRSTEDVYSDPGNPVMTWNEWGRPVMWIQKDNSIFLTGNGSSPDGDLPFLDRMDLTSQKISRLWRCEAPYYETVVGLLDNKRFLTSRESQTENPNYWLRTVGTKNPQPVTQFPNPYPQLKDLKKEVLRYKRDDGVELTADLYLPPGYKKEDGPLPTFLWAYPIEFKSKANAGQVRGSSYTFTRINWGSPVYWAMRGYAILNNATIPIVGEGTAEPNDTYIQQLVGSAKAAIDYGVALGVVDKNRVGVGGHSYGAFMTANLLAHSDLFKAGIARSGAYNRTLTPFGFQNEERSYWEAPEVYYNMSPFSFANQIKEPLLLVHGEADNNSGTFPIQSERFYSAIKGHGGTSRFVLLPYESHGYSAKESILHMLYEMDTWLETYVKKSNNPANTQINLKN